MSRRQISTTSVDLYTIDLDPRAVSVERCWPILSGAERRRAIRFRTSQLKTRWLVARAGLRVILSRYCGSPPQALRFDYGKFGKPAVAGPDSKQRLHFNLSHSRGRALVAVTVLAPVGVDIEFQQPLRDWKELAELCFSTEEYEQLLKLPSQQCQAAFYRCWTRKEAVIKATGKGFSSSLKSFTVAFAPGAPASVDFCGEVIGPSRWQIEHVELSDGYIGAIALRSTRHAIFNHHGMTSLFQ